LSVIGVIGSLAAVTKVLTAQVTPSSAVSWRSRFAHTFTLSRSRTIHWTPS